MKVSILLMLFIAAASIESFAGGSVIKIIALGDSTTAGTPYYESPVEVSPQGSGDEQASYPYWLGSGHSEWKVENHGVNGERSDEIAARFEEDQVSADVVIVLAGVNDLYQGYPSEHVQAQLARIYDIAAQRKMKVVGCTILPYNESDPLVRKRMDEVNVWIRRQAKERGFLFCDTHVLASDPARPGKLAVSSDGLHPDRSVYKKIGLALADILQMGLEAQN